MLTRRKLFGTLALIAAPSIAFASKTPEAILDAAYNPLFIQDDYFICLPSTPVPDSYLAEWEYFRSQQNLMASMTVPSNYMSME